MNIVRVGSVNVTTAQIRQQVAYANSSLSQAHVQIEINLVMGTSNPTYFDENGNVDPLCDDEQEFVPGASREGPYTENEHYRVFGEGTTTGRLLRSDPFQDEADVTAYFVEGIHPSPGGGFAVHPTSDYGPSVVIAPNQVTDQRCLAHEILHVMGLWGHPDSSMMTSSQLERNLMTQTDNLADPTQWQLGIDLTYEQIVAVRNQIKSQHGQ